MKRNTAGIQWNPKVPRAMIRRLYETDARGIVDEELIDEAGFALYARCQSILAVDAGHVQCPDCDHMFATPWKWPRQSPRVIDAESIRCPNCQEWEVTGRQYRESFQYDNLGAGNALPAFQTFVERYPHTTAPRERMLLIDRLIHEFHYAISHKPDGSLGRNSLPHETTANNLIEGGHDQVVAFLDRLTYGDAGTPELQAVQTAWRTKAAEMKQRRSPKR